MAAAESSLQDTQEPVLRFLADPATHGLAAGAVKRIDTHGAIVFLAGPRVYKIKRAVKYPYLDFSTLEKRAAAIDAEIEANQPFSPELYLGKTAVRRAADGKLSLQGNGEAVEWALVLRRFDENATLDHVAERQGIGDALARALGEAIAAAHQRAPRFDAARWIEALGRFVEDEISAFLAAPEVIRSDDADRLGSALRTTLAKNRPLLVARGEAGHIRRGHGDLHLRNVALIDGKPVLFDALEFDPVVAAGDVLYDLAFLLMDLIDRKLDRAANIVFNRYLVAAADDDHLDAFAALPFFLSLRSAIRARVALDKRKLVQGKERQAAEAEAQDYAALALRLISPPPPRLVAVGGLSGTGKTTIAARLAPPLWPAPGAVHLRSDIERKRLAGVGELERLPPDAYTPEAAAPVYARLIELAKRALAAGHSVVVDAVYARPGERAAIEAAAAETGVPFQGVWLELSLQERIARVGGRRGDASDADAAVVRAQEEYALGEIGWRRVDAAGSPEEVASRAQAALA
ncbi:MAG: AAA family ATPase [Bradyrhizobiaceae bacterium]|nr:AAA family ATPase [Bradyrhizobiaceae bacterium]